MGKVGSRWSGISGGGVVSSRRVPGCRSPRRSARFRRAIGSAVGDACRSVAEVADSFGVSWPTAHAAVVAGAEQIAGEPEPTAVLGIDETRRGKPRWARDEESGRWVPTDAYDTGFVDLAGRQGLLGQVSGRTSSCVVTWLRARPPEFREAILFVAIDPDRSPRTG